jgi:hypothetical protein
MPDNAADRKDIRRREKAARINDASRHACIRNVMSTIEGRHWLWDVLGDCHVFATTFTGDALQTAFNEGSRNVGLRLLADIMLACPDQYVQAQREANVRSTTDERRSSALGDGRDSGSGDDAASDAASNPTDGWDNPDYDPFDTSGRNPAQH